MAFKTVKSYNEEKFNGLFLLRNDGDYADVIFMYRNVDDVLVADTHYVKSADYSGYVHCCGRGCPACGKGIRVQTKLFIPMFNIMDNELQFWDRGIRFESQLEQDVFSKYPNPSEFVFRITRHGVAGDVNTTYEIVAIGKNTFKSYSQILSECNASFPEYYNNICKDWSCDKLHSVLSSTSDSGYSSNSDMPSYQVSPRNVSNYSNMSPETSSEVPPTPNFTQNSVDAESVPSADDEELDGDVDF